MSETQSMTTTSRSDGAWPGWFNGKDINEALFCRDFLFRHELVYSGNPFFTPEGRLTDLLPLKEQIFTELEGCAVKNIPRTICNIAELMKLSAHVEDFPPLSAGTSCSGTNWSIPAIPSSPRRDG